MTQDETNLLPGTVWYDPKSQRIVIIHNTNKHSVYYRNLGTDTVYQQPIEGFISTFTWQSHSPRSKTLSWA